MKNLLSLEAKVFFCVVVVAFVLYCKAEMISIVLREKISGNGAGILQARILICLAVIDGICLLLHKNLD